MKKTIFLMAMMSAVALVSVSCRNGGDDKPVIVSKGKEIPLSAEKLSQIGKFHLVEFTSSLGEDFNKDGVKNTDLLKELNLCGKFKEDKEVEEDVKSELVFKSPDTYEFNNSCSKRNVVWGFFNVDENEFKEKSISFWRGNVPYKTYYDVSLTEKDGKYYLKLKYKISYIYIDEETKEEDIFFKYRQLVFESN